MENIWKWLGTKVLQFLFVVVLVFIAVKFFGWGLSAINVGPAQFSPPTSDSGNIQQSEVNATAISMIIQQTAGAAMQQTSVASQQQHPTQPPSLSVPNSYSGMVPFADSNNPNQLNSLLGWQPGGSSASGYDLTLNPAWLTVITGKETDQVQGTDTAPLILYKYAGNFEATVKVEFVSIICCQHAGIGVRSIQDHTTWLRIAKHEYNGMRAAANQAGTVFWLNYAPYANSIIHFKIERRNSIFNMYYSDNGVNWVTIQKDYIFELPDEVEIYLLVLSAHNNEGIVAKFSDFTVIPK
jgi:regulation of enolase protein 1 (concanavalin A-like superfamily)